MVSNGVLEFVREDDYIEYYLFPQLSDNDAGHNEELNEILKRVEVIADKFCEGYIWHREPFHVKARPGNSHLLIDHQGQTSPDGDAEQLPAHLHGITHYGDNIEDEWFIVALLYELTRQINRLIVRTVDGDGEFLLIEVANWLPDWANPETCQQRVFIADGGLCLLPNNQGDDNILPIAEGVSKIRENISHFRVSKDIENCISCRIGGYPEKARDNLHRAVAFVPVGVAALLRHKPTLIASAIREFCSRDSVDLKVCRAMRFFPPETRVRTSVTFTKCLYAMLMHSSYVPDRRTGWNLPSVASKEFKEHSLGMKIACGFEILASQAKPDNDFSTNRHWTKYLDSLKVKGYFQDFLEGSKDYTRLLETAKDFFMENISDVRVNSITGQELLDDLKSIEYSIEEFRKMEASLQPSDDDSWLNVDPGELDRMLNERYGESSTPVNGITHKLTDFLAQKSSIEGVEVEASQSPAPVRPQRGVKKTKGKVQFSAPAAEETDSPAGNTVDFDPDAFQSHVKNLLDLVIPEDKWDDSQSDMSDYGDDSAIDRNIDEMNVMKTKTSLDVYMNQMDRELAKTTIGESFEKKKISSGDDTFDDIEDFQPVDIDLNTLKNMMESYQAQLGGPGPASNLLGAMGVRLKPPTTSEKDEPMPEAQV